MSELDPVTQLPEEPAAPAGAQHEVPAARAEPSRKRSSTGVFLFGTLSGCLVAMIGASFFGLLLVALRTDSGEIDFTTDKVAVVAIEGEIVEARDTIEAIHRYAENAWVRAIVVRIDSPGGAIAPSQEIYEEIRKIRAKSGKPFVASLDTMAASGGFYIASACDEIVANPGSITGSIGVILQWMDLKELLAWAKMKPETIASGPLKAAGSPYRELTEAERQYFQRIVTQLHRQFVRAVAEGRKGKLTESEVAGLADGRIFTGEEALALKLVDRLGNLDDAITAAAKLAGVKGKPGTIYPKKRKKGLLDLLSDSGDAESMVERIVSRRLPRFLYRW